jgi:putative endonuclease
MHFVYILYSLGRKKFYIGETVNLKARLAQHNAGKVKSTRSFVPWHMVWSCEKGSRKEALILEKKLKNLGSQARVIAFIKKHGVWEFDE